MRLRPRSSRRCGVGAWTTDRVELFLRRPESQA